MKSDSVQSRFLVGNLGNVFERNAEAKVETASASSIAALARLNKRTKGIDHEFFMSSILMSVVSRRYFRSDGKVLVGLGEFHFLTAFFP